MEDTELAEPISLFCLESEKGVSLPLPGLTPLHMSKVRSLGCRVVGKLMLYEEVTGFVSAGGTSGW